jgi:hypothetical protein
MCSIEILVDLLQTQTNKFHGFHRKSIYSLSNQNLTPQATNILFELRAAASRRTPALHCTGPRTLPSPLPLAPQI